MGTETEYGITVPGQTTANHMLASSQVVNGYLNATTGTPRDRRPRWDFEEESPLRDARGFDAAAGPVIGASRDAADTLADDEIGLANVILTNGARLYVDHAHPEYSTPEVTNPRDAVIWDKAGSASWSRRPSTRQRFRVPGQSSSTRTTRTTKASPTARMRTI